MSIEWALLTFGIALLLVALVGRVKVKGIEVGTGTMIARLGVGLTGLTLVAFSFFYSGFPSTFVVSDSNRSEDSAELRSGETAGTAQAQSEQRTRAGEGVINQANARLSIQLLTGDRSDSSLLQRVKELLELQGYTPTVWAGSLDYHESGYGLPSGTLVGARSIIVFHDEASEIRAGEFAALLETVPGVERTELMIDLRSGGPDAFGIFFPPGD